MMEGWKEYYLKDIVDDLIMGQSPDSSSYNNEKKGIAFVQGNADMQKGFPLIRMHTTDPKRFSELGDILLSVRAPVGDVFYNNYGNLAIGRGLSAIRINNKDIRTLVFYLLHYDKKQLERLEQGTTFTEIGKKEVRNIRIVIPQNHVEQTAIAAMLSKVDEAIASVQGSIAAAERLKKSLMQNLLTGRMKPDGTLRTEEEFYLDEKFGRVPKGWEVKRLKDICLNSGDYGANASAIEYDETKPRFIRITDIDDFGQLLDDGKACMAGDCSKKYMLEEDDFLFARTGDTVGKSLLYKKEMGLAVFAGYLIKFTFDKNLVMPDYFDLIAKSEFFEAFKVAMKRVGAKPNINSREYCSFKFLLPSDTKEQKEIYSKFANIDKSQKSKQQKIAVLERLKKSLMQNLLTGRVRVKE
jgi:type I restriction enzyme S subunit